MTIRHFTESLIGLVYPPSKVANLLLTFTTYSETYSNIDEELYGFFYSYLWLTFPFYFGLFILSASSNTFISNLFVFFLPFGFLESPPTFILDFAPDYWSNSILFGKIPIFKVLLWLSIIDKSLFFDFFNFSAFFGETSSFASSPKP